MTLVAVAPGTGRSLLRLRSDVLAVRVLEQDADGARVGLVASGALLVAGDVVRIEVEVEDGGWLEIVETAGTVAYGGAEESHWNVDVRLGAGATLIWDALPFVVSDGARVRRRSHVRLGVGARALLRETFVLGRAGQAGGDLWSSLDAVDTQGPLQHEELDLERAVRELPGVLATGARGAAVLSVVDTVLALGWRPAPAPSSEVFELDRPGAYLRWLGTDLHRNEAGDRCLARWREELTAVTAVQEPTSRAALALG